MSGFTIVRFLHPRATPDHIGTLPGMLDPENPEPAARQFNHNYAHGGGWRPQPGFTLADDFSLKYPGDPWLHPFAQIHFRDEQELIFVYEYGIVCIVQPDRSFEVCRMD
jgi:hypothetical protein